MYVVNTSPIFDDNITPNNNKEHIDTNDSEQYLQPLINVMVESDILKNGHNS